MEFRKMVIITLYTKQKKRHRCTEQTFGLWEKARVGCFKRTSLKHVYYIGWNRSAAQVGCMRRVLGPSALGRHITFSLNIFNEFSRAFLMLSDCLPSTE